MKKVLVALSAMLLIAPVILWAGTEELQTNKQFTIRGGKVTMKGGTRVSLYPNGAIKSGTLGDTFTYRLGSTGTLVFAPDKSMYFAQDGKVTGGYLQQPSTLRSRYGNFYVPKGGWVAFHDNGMFARIDLGGTQRLIGMPGNKSIAIKKFIIFSNGGTPKSVYLARDQKIKGYTFQAGRDSVDFHATGHVKRGVLAKNYTKRIGRLRLKKKTYKAGKPYTFNQRGDIQ
ncbi:MAG TPA: hypothetical protein PK544_17015 [Spirochaetota bacterium]|nr:hypothetical protein [Spirochaetota bacterium]